MKKSITLMLLLLMVIPVMRSQEFLLHDEQFTWTKDADICGGYHYWYDLGEAPSTNWKTPYDYQNGLYYFRFEIIDQPSNEPFKLNMCIWTERDGSYWKEQCTGFSPTMAGSGSVYTYSTTVNYALNGVPIDWTDLSKLWRMGNPIYVNGHNLGPSKWCTDNPEEWVHVDDYFPMTLRVTVVAVASGYSFSGWDNYANPPDKQPTPSYGIDFLTEKTNKVVPSTDEYSFNASMTGAVNGNGQKLNLTPGTDVYFRTKASGEILASDIQHLVVPSRPSTPSFSVDYINERTVQNVGPEIEYSTSSSYTNPVSGSGSRITLTPGQDLYLWYKATSSTFASGDYHLVVPVRPAAPSITIDYANERTSSIASTMEYSTQSDMSSVTSGSNAAVNLTPGENLYIRFKATASSFKSAVQTLSVPARAETPAITIDFSNERTSAIPSSMEYSTHSDMSSATAGANASVMVTPGIDLYIRAKATGSSFKSAVQTLNVPDRPATPSFAIDYENESTAVAVTSAFEYSDNENMASAVSGANVKLPLLPGSTRYFRMKATSAQFVSGVQELRVPDRPATPVYSVDFVNEQTVENVPSTHEYDVAGDMSSSQTGNGTKLKLIPGTGIYFRVKSTASSFVSENFHLEVPERPVLNTAVEDTFKVEHFSVTVDFHKTVTGFDASDVEAVNAGITITNPLTFKVTPAAAGIVAVKIKANAVLESNFASDTLKVFDDKVSSSVPDIDSQHNGLMFYPVPANNVLNIRISGQLQLPVELQLFDSQGKFILHKLMVLPEDNLDLGTLPSGFYILKAIDKKGTVATGKVTKN